MCGAEKFKPAWEDNSLICADFQAQTCLTTVDNPFSSVCTPAKGLRPTSGPSPISFNSSQVVWLTEPKEAAIPTNPGLRVSNFRQLDDKTVAFQVQSTKGHVPPSMLYIYTSILLYRPDLGLACLHDHHSLALTILSSEEFMKSHIFSLCSTVCPSFCNNTAMWSVPGPSAVQTLQEYQIIQSEKPTSVDIAPVYSVFCMKLRHTCQSERGLLCCGSRSRLDKNVLS